MKDIKKIQKEALSEVVSDSKAFNENFNNEEHSNMFVEVLKYLATR